MNFCFRVNNCIKKKVRVVSLAHHRPTGPPLYTSYIIKLFQTVWELRPAQDFNFRGGYITKIVRVFSLARDMLTGPPLYSYMSECIQIMECTRMHLQILFQGR